MRITERRASLLRDVRSIIERFRNLEYDQLTPICNAYCDGLVQQRLDEILNLVKRGPRSGVKPRAIRKMVNDLYEHRMDGHQVIQNSATRLVYTPPLCIQLLEDLNMAVGREFNRVGGMILGRYKDAKRRVDWTGCNAGLDAKTLWPYGYLPSL